MAKTFGDLFVLFLHRIDHVQAPLSPGMDDLNTTLADTTIDERSQAEDEENDENGESGESVCVCVPQIGTLDGERFSSAEDWRAESEAREDGEARRVLAVRSELR